MKITRPLIGYHGCCKFAVTCSKYSQQALRKHHLLKACWLILKRVLSCW